MLIRVNASKGDPTLDSSVPRRTMRSLIIYNLTPEELYVWPAHNINNKPIVLPPNVKQVLDVSESWKRVLTLAVAKECGLNEDDSCQVQESKVKFSGGRRWRLVHNCREWRMYAVKATKESSKLVILAKRDLSSFMASLSDDLPLSSLCLPGTHNSLAFYGWPIAQCQFPDLTLLEQLQSGIRVLDIRMSVIKGRLRAYHGISPQKTLFSVVLSTIYTFFSSHPSETIIMLIKQEDYARTPPPVFSSLVRTEIYAGAGGMGMWYLQNRVPKLAEVRGKVVMFSRFGGDGSGWHGGLEGLGIHPTAWPDSSKEGFSWQCKNTLVRTHDWYNIHSFLSIPEKVSLATKILLDFKEQKPPVLNISFLSAASVPLALPGTIARGLGWPRWNLGFEGVNSRVMGILLDQLATLSTANTELNINEKAEDITNVSGIRGWVMMDYFNNPENLSSILVELNFVGR